MLYLVLLENDTKTKLSQICIPTILDLEHKLRATEEKLNNIMDSSLIGEIDDDSIFSFATIYQLNISEADQVSDNLPVVLRYGIYSNSSLIKNLVGNYIQNGVLHPCEKAIFLKAFEYLNSAESTVARANNRVKETSCTTKKINSIIKIN